jgi:hypothetical protein
MRSELRAMLAGRRGHGAPPDATITGLADLRAVLRNH